MEVGLWSTSRMEVGLWSTVQKQNRSLSKRLIICRSASICLFMGYVAIDQSTSYVWLWSIHFHLPYIELNAKKSRIVDTLSNF